MSREVDALIALVRDLPICRQLTGDRTVFGVVAGWGGGVLPQALLQEFQRLTLWIVDPNTPLAEMRAHTAAWSSQVILMPMSSQRAGGHRLADYYHFSCLDCTTSGERTLQDTYLWFLLTMSSGFVFFTNLTSCLKDVRKFCRQRKVKLELPKDKSYGWVFVGAAGNG